MAGRDLGPTFLAERLVLAVPYIFVDNPMSYLGGRETYGYAKTMAKFNPADAVGEHVTMEAFGGNFGRDEGAAWRPFWRSRRSAPTTGFRSGRSRVRRACTPARGRPARRQRGGEIVLADLRLTAELIESMLAGQVHQLFLKQFRDAVDGTRACYQSVVEAPVNVLRVEQARRPRCRCDHSQARQPPDRPRLGVTSQRADRVRRRDRHGGRARRRGRAAGVGAALLQARHGRQRERLHQRDRDCGPARVAGAHRDRTAAARSLPSRLTPPARSAIGRRMLCARAAAPMRRGPGSRASLEVDEPESTAA